MYKCKKSYYIQDKKTSKNKPLFIKGRWYKITFSYGYVFLDNEKGPDVDRLYRFFMNKGDFREEQIDSILND